MSFTITRLHPHIGTEIGGIDLSEPIDAATVQEIWRAIDQYAVLVFRDQYLTDRQLHDFAARFGELEIRRSALRPGKRRLAIPQTGDTSTLDEDNRIRAREDRKRLDGLGNRLWHTDASYMPVPVVLGMLFAPMRLTCPYRSCSACCSRSRCRRLRHGVPARPSSPTCAPPTTRWERRRK